MSDAVNQIKDRLNIVDVISPYVELHKAGKNFKGKSPFSAEKTPSFYVSPDRGMYYCFSTSQGGDIFTFIQAMEGVDFKEALKLLAQKAGVELVPEDPKKKSERERLFAVLKDATEFYVSQLSEKAEAKDYLRKRKVSEETIQTWQIGYAPGPPEHGWREVKEYLEKKGYTKDEMLKAGLIKTTEGGKEPFDVFRDRVMFPMSDNSGKVVAFSGRILTPSEKAPKYVNSPETELYKKSELLFGYDKAKHGIRQLDFSLIVEGQFDVVMSHQAGYTNTVAVSGTALTLQHVQLLERLSDRVVLALDADRAGISAVKRGAELMLSRGLDVKVAELPEGKDPADLVAEGKDVLKKVIGKSVHVIEFIFHVARQEAKDERALRQAVEREVFPFIFLLPSEVEQYSFIQILAKESKVPVDVLWRSFERYVETQKTKPDYSQEVEESIPGKVPEGETVDLVERSYVYVLAAKDLLPAEQGDNLVEIIKNIESLKTITVPNEPKLAETSFILEQHFEHMPKNAVLEEIVAKLNQLRSAIARKAINELRLEMDALTSDEQITLLQKISDWEKVLRQEPFKLEDLTK